ncbi:SGNH/GDSL hydrolase family protein [Curtobacterium flaccumfaciens]|nr:SGNH/GDSL hydrolase family protein [Curtobacterium flaccumfaciens]
MAGCLMMLPAVSDACQTAPDAADVSATRAAAAISRGSDVLIVGDSYTTGRGSHDGTHGWAQDLATERGWDATIDGVPGTGYVSIGATNSTRWNYLSRIERRAALDPQLVLVQGSQNDWLVSSDALEARVERTLRTARHQWPNAVVVAIGPSAPVPRAETTGGISSAVAAGARAAGVPYVDALGERWFTQANSASYAAADEQHLNDAGYLYLAGRIEDALDELATPTEGDQCA